MSLDTSHFISHRVSALRNGFDCIFVMEVKARRPYLDTSHFISHRVSTFHNDSDCILTPPMTCRNLKGPRADPRPHYIEVHGDMVCTH
jgi:hypothetical protein